MCCSGSTTIFLKCTSITEQYQRVTEHIRKKLEEQGVPDVDRRVLTLVPTLDGALLLPGYHR
jgi:hypothetical protein